MKTRSIIAGLVLAVIAGVALAQSRGVNFATLDQDKDGYLTPQEFTSFCGGYGRGMMGQAGPRGQNQQGVGMMNGLNGQNQLDSDNMMNGQNQQGIGMMNGNGRGWGMQMMDTDGDGKISEAEFNNHWTAQHQSRFNQLDTNQDGVLDAKELAIMPRHQINGSTEAWIKLYDKNGNGTLNSEEFTTVKPGN
jgi:Ca2+-binding EF-hand superfamily protein